MQSFSKTEEKREKWRREEEEEEENVVRKKKSRGIIKEKIGRERESE